MIKKDYFRLKNGKIIFKKNFLFELIYNQENISDKIFEKDEDIEIYNNLIKKNELDWEKVNMIEIENIEDFFVMKKELKIPDFYKNLDIKEYLLKKIQTEEERKRVNYELYFYEKNNLIDILLIIKYLVDFMKKNNIIYGVGRGSSVSSYVLYLLGAHRIDSIKYDLDFHDFIKN
ncbi:MAG: hypothetical protein NZZ41_00570 [Candidatus Dojkabacteria bacterium]|nr:hypothetical protein [Candidatus Dojkabacteria bacterium]